LKQQGKQEIVMNGEIPGIFANPFSHSGKIH